MDVRKLVSRYQLSRPVSKAYVELVNEVFYSLQQEVKNMMDILNTETMDNNFLLEWINFYGLQLNENPDGSFDRNVLKRYRALLRKRGEVGSIQNMIQSGGGLYISPDSPMAVEVYPWYKCPEDIDPDPIDGIFYMRASDRRVLSMTPMLAKVIPAGYKFDLLMQYAAPLLKEKVEIFPLQNTQYQERGPDLSIIVSGGYRDSVDYNRLAELQPSTFNERWTFTSAHKDGHSITELTQVRKNRYGGVYHRPINYDAVNVWDKEAHVSASSFNERWTTAIAVKDGYTYGRLSKSRDEHYGGVDHKTVECVQELHEGNVGRKFSVFSNLWSITSSFKAGKAIRDFNGTRRFHAVYHEVSFRSPALDGFASLSPTIGLFKVPQTVEMHELGSTVIETSMGDKLPYRSVSVEGEAGPSGTATYTPYWTIGSAYERGSKLVDIKPSKAEGSHSKYESQGGS